MYVFMKCISQEVRYWVAGVVFSTGLNENSARYEESSWRCLHVSNCGSIPIRRLNRADRIYRRTL